MGPALVAVTGAVIAFSTWNRTADVIVDSGREAYTAWRLSEGAVLYRDIAWFNGPLSAYWNALWFWLFGPSLQTLEAVNLALLAMFVAFIYRWIAGLSDSRTATVASLLVLVFGELGDGEIFNFVAPYSHEGPHGLMCGLAAVACMGQWEQRRDSRWVVAAGLFAGLAVLTKIEMALAGILAPLVGLAFAGQCGFRERAALAAGFVGSAGLIVAIAFCGLLLVSDAETARSGVVWPWRGLLATDVMKLRFYRQGMGLDDPARNIGLIVLESGGWLLALGSWAALAMWRSSAQRARDRLVRLLFLLTLPLALCVDWDIVAMPLPVAILAFGFVAVCDRSERGLAVRGGRVALAAYALLVASKMLLNPRLYQYGFVLALPGVLIVTVALLHRIPRFIEERGGQPGIFRVGAWTLLALTAGIYAGSSCMKLAINVERVRSGPDELLTNARGPVVRRALGILSGTRPTDTLAVFPEGVMLNYLARRRTSIPYLFFTPAEILLQGESHMLDALKAAPPDRIAIVHRQTSEIGPAWFGRDYGRSLAEWIYGHYRTEEVIGDPPLQPASKFGIAILTRIR